MLFGSKHFQLADLKINIYGTALNWWIEECADASFYQLEFELSILYLYMHAEP